MPVHSRCLRSPSPGPPWFKLGLILLILGTVPLYLFLRQRLSRVETAAYNDIMASHHVVQQAAQRDDAELFNALWADSNHLRDDEVDLLFEQSVRLERHQLGLDLQLERPDVVDVSFGPNLDMAYLIAEQIYTTPAGSPLVLQQAYVYQLIEDQWLFTLPNAEFWGETLHIDAPRLTVIFPARDEMIARQLTTDLHALVEHLCQAPQVDCPPQLVLSLDLVTTYQIGANLRRHGRTAVLPTPTLLGIPVDEAGYQTLYRYYGRHLAELIWQLLPSHRWPSRWYNGRLTEAAWSELLSQQQVLLWPLPTAPLPNDWPEATVATVCPNNQQGLDWWHYAPGTATWHKTTSFSSVQALHPLAEAAFLLQVQEAWFVVWSDGHYQALATSAYDDPRIVPEQQGAHIRLLSSGETAVNYQLTLQDCQEGACVWQSAPEAVIPSPNGRQQLSQQGSTIILGDTSGQQLSTIAQALSPFWMQDRFFGYLQFAPDGSGDLQVYATDIRTTETFPLFSTEDLRAMIPARPDTIIINAILRIPTDTTRLTVEVFIPEQRQELTFSFYRSTGNLTLLSSTTNTPADPASNQWFLTMEAGLIWAHAHDTQESYTISPPTPACVYPTWTNHGFSIDD